MSGIRSMAAVASQYRAIIETGSILLVLLLESRLMRDGFLAKPALRFACSLVAWPAGSGHIEV